MMALALALIGHIFYFVSVDRSKKLTFSGNTFSVREWSVNDFQPWLVQVTSFGNSGLSSALLPVGGDEAGEGGKT